MDFRGLETQGISKNPCFDRSYESDMTVGVVRPQPLPLLQKRRVSGVFRDAHNEIMDCNHGPKVEIVCLT
jgi:hypothetical protein